MEYSIKKLSDMAGVSARTLRYYDEIALLKPTRINGNGYRLYGQKEVDLLQQILFYRAMGVPLNEVKRIILSNNFDEKAALENHLTSLLVKREQLNRLIETVEKSISTMEGETNMTDQEKFEGFKEKILIDNEQKYGEEIREKFGDNTIRASNNKLKNMTQEKYTEMENLSIAFNAELKTAFLQGDSSSALAQKVCAMHKKWLCYFWDSYSKEAHIGVTQMYVDDPRFTEYYDKIAVGCAAFLRDAVQIFCGME